jgi:drug/metabolite transporter (DMT)-like permease
MLKAATPVVVLLFSSAFGLEKPTFMELNIVVIISLGVALASLGELLFSWTGFFYQISGIVAESGRLTLTGVLLKKLKLDSLSTLYYVAPLCAVFNLIVFLFMEAGEVPWDRVFTGAFINMLLFNGAVAFSLNIASVMLIAHTSPLILTLAGIVKDILLVFMSMAIFGSPVTTLQFLGYSVTLLALNLHKEYKKLVPVEAPAATTNTNNSNNSNTSSGNNPSNGDEKA